MLADVRPKDLLGRGGGFTLIFSSTASIVLRAIGDDVDFDFGKVFVDPRMRSQSHRRNKMLH